MIEKVKKVFVSMWKSEGQEDLQTPMSTSVKFTLFYKELTIGYLNLDNGVWSFEYSDDFKNQSIIQPLTDFPDIDKVYSSEELYPFFTQRIPSLSQPKVKAVIEKEKIDKTNEVELLKRFGKVSITNPFRLNSAF